MKDENMTDVELSAECEADANFLKNSLNKNTKVLMSRLRS